MYYRSDYDELFTHLCWKYELDPYDTDGEKLEKVCTEDEAYQLMLAWDPEYDD